ncbi:hypothetical protein BDR26DRAFT_443094 [Obelidium mucronatum]|nr:hypothetical protein BDR26DRAFT_443094 [Obelidium mucronatum]
MDDLFVIDRAGAPGQTAAPEAPAYNTFIPLRGPPTSAQHRTPLTTRAFQTQPRHRPKKGKGRHAAGAARTPNYGFPAAKPAIDWRGRPGAGGGGSDDDADAELVRDYLANLDCSDDGAGAGWNVSRLADMQALGVGGFSDEDEEDNVDVRDMLDDLGSDDSSGEDFEEQDAAVKPKQRSGNRFELPEAGIHEALTEIADESVEDELKGEESHDSDGDDDSDDSLDLANIYIEGDSDGMEEEAAIFTGGKSKWNKSSVSPATAAKAANFNQIHNGSFKRLKSERVSSASDEESGVNDGSAPPLLSKSARRKTAKRERKQKHDKDRELREALKQEVRLTVCACVCAFIESATFLQQARIAHTVAKKKAGAAIDAEITRILHKVNKTIYEFMLAENSDLPSVTLPAMPGAIRRLVKDMAPYYALTITLRGSGGDKQLVLHRNKKSNTPSDWQSVVGKVLSKKGNKVLKGNTWSGKKSGKKTRRGPPGAPDDRTAPRPGDVVGEGAAPLAEDNLGHKMMLMMGWAPGEALGASSDPPLPPSSSSVNAGVGMGSYGGSGLGFVGSSAADSGGSNSNSNSSGFKLVEPISVTIRAKRRGLGAE